jgi:hypothetical protein
MAESLVSLILVGGLVVVSLNTLGATKTAEQSTSDRTRAQLLATALMSEIMTAAYSEPDAGRVELGKVLKKGLTIIGSVVLPLGLDGGENSTSRVTFDDVDDYDPRCESPPQYKDGTAIPGFGGWSRCVEVILVDPTNVNLPTQNDMGVKRITVTVKKGSEGVAQVVAIRTGIPVSVEGVINPEAQ